MFGVEPMCRILQIAQSTYYELRAIARDPDRASARAKSDAAVSLKIDAAWDADRKLYGARRIGMFCEGRVKTPPAAPWNG